jgi:hypothetical protein
MTLALPIKRPVLTPGWSRNELTRKAKASPSLDLRFAENKSLVDATTGANLVTFTRASSGTFVGSDGLIKTATTNLLLRSEEFNDASWSKFLCTITQNSIAAPDGQVTADLLVEDTTNGFRALQQSFTAVASTAYAFSVYIKAGDRTFARVYAGTSASWTSAPSAIFNLSTGAVQSGSNASIAAVGNGWYRCTVTGTFGATGGATAFLVGPVLTSGGTNSYLGTGANAIYVWGAQLEQSSTVGEYIPTTSTINSAPRFDHNPTTGESLGLLVEEARTNLTQKSQEFADVYWTKTVCTITANESTAPDGTLTANLWNNTSSPGSIANSITKDATPRTYTASVWVKGTLSQFTFSIDSGVTTDRGRCQFNLSTNTVSGVFNEGAFTNTSGTLTVYPNGWVRLTVTTTTSTGTTIRFRPFFSGSSASVRIWGAQIEEGAFATSYIPTTTATVTRSADVASISGSNFSGWYRQDEGTVFSDWRSNEANNYGIAEISDGTATARIINFVDGSNVLRHRAAVAGVNSFNGADSYASNSFNRTVLGYKANDHAGVNNGGTVLTSNTGGVPAVNTLVIGGISSGSLQLNGTIRRLTYWPQRLPNSTLQTLTQ